MTLMQVRAQIRFALEQLKPQNRHHEFETITREFSRQRICKNILPATGPVGAGGDQGKDFETFKTYLTPSIAIDKTSLFEGVTTQGNLFFACSLQQDIIPKIKKDINTIFSHTQELRPVIYFCVEDIPVAKRHDLINWCNETHKADLQIFDGQALSENLSDEDIFWIAIEYLHIPADLYPKKMNASVYNDRLNKWKSSQPQSFADFCEIKYGVRKATFKEKCKPDLPVWINALKHFLQEEDSSLKRRAQYEICVAALRGQNNLTPYRDLVLEYFKDIEGFLDPLELVDIGVLLSYCSTAKTVGEFEVSVDFLHETSKRFCSHLDSCLKKAESAHSRCALLDLRARAAFLPYLLGSTPQVNFEDAYVYWDELVTLVEEAPLFPLEQFCDILTQLTPVMGEDQKFLTVTSKVDELLVKRTGGFSAAEKCRDRAVAFYQAGNVIQAIDHLHRAKINWFAAETIRGTILCSLFLARCYDSLGLSYAAKFYALSATFLSFVHKEKEYDLVSQSLFELASIVHHTGEWAGFFSVMNMALLSHHNFDPEPLNIEKHEALQVLFTYTSIIRTLSKRFWPAASSFVEGLYAKWPLDLDTRNALNSLTNDKSHWTMEPLEAIWPQIDADLYARPLNDLEEIRQIKWRALGISWQAEFTNDFNSCAVSEELVATLQVLLADLARDDLQLLPVNVSLKVHASEDKKFHFTDQSDNKRLEWKIEIPMHIADARERRVETIFAYTAYILGVCTTLTADAFQQRIEAALKRGLTSKTFFAEAYSRLYSEVMEVESHPQVKGFFAEADRIFTIKEHDSLKWKDGPGLSYSEATALMHVKNRYNKLSKVLPVIWPKVIASEKHREFFEALHLQGFRDWHLGQIACNAIGSEFARLKHWKGAPDDEFMQATQKTIFEMMDGTYNDELEQFHVQKIDLSHFEMQLKTSFVAILRTWQLSIHTPTPDFEAIKRFLCARYFIFDTDLPHDDLFPAS